MYNLNDRRKLAEIILNSIQDLVYGVVKINEDLILQKFTLYIFNKDDFKYSCNISDILYKIETEEDINMYVNDIFTDYKRIILGNYIV